MNTQDIDQKLMTELAVELQPFPETLEFIVLYREYIHAIDDLIDCPKRPTSEELLAVFAKASRLFSTTFWIKHSNLLIVTEQLANNTYADSVLWEDSAIASLRTASDTLRHSGLDMFFGAILITLGRDKLREWSTRFRSQCHKLQSDPEDIK